MTDPEPPPPPPPPPDAPAAPDHEAPPSDDPAARAPARGFFAALVLVCALVFAATVHLALQREVLDTSDEAGYSEQADALLAGEGLTVGYVQFHHTKGSPDIAHAAALYPPGTGALLAVAYRLFGRSEASAALPSALFQCLVLPLLAFLLARRLGASGPFAFACGGAVLLDMVLREAAFQGLADLPFSVCILAAGLLALRTSRTSALVAGLLLAGGYWFKPAALLFTPGTAVLRVFGTGRPFSRALLDVGVMALAFLAGVAPWLWRNHELYGDPTYSANKHITAIANKPGFDYDDNYRAYWTDPEFEVPSMAESLDRYGAHAVVSRFLVHVYESFVSKGRVVFGFVFWVAAFLLLRRRGPRAVVLHLLLFALALSAVFAVEVRYLMPCIPFALAVAWVGLQRVVAEAGVRRATAAALALLVLWAAPGAVTLARDLAFGLPGGGRGDVCIRDAALWVGENTPEDARVLTHQPFRTRYYSGRLCVMLPFDTPDRIQTVIDHYGIDTIVMNDWGILAESSERYLDPYFAEHGDAWERIRPEGATFTVYRRR